MKQIFKINFVVVILIILFIQSIECYKFLSINDPRLQIHEFNHDGQKFIASNFPMVEDENQEVRFLEVNQKEKISSQYHSKIQRRNLIKNQKFKSNQKSKFSHKTKGWGSEIDQDQDYKYCINKKSFNDDQLINQAQEFIQGPCYPIILIPGMMGSRIKVTLDCENLDAEVLKQCFDHQKSYCESYQKFNLWFSFFGQTGLFSKYSYNNCLGVLMKLSVNQLDKIQKLQPQKDYYKGVKVEWDDDGDLRRSDCGLTGISNLNGGTFGNSISGSLIGYSYMSGYLRNMGYMLGISIFGLPYDWRQRTGANLVGEKLVEMIKYASKLNKKKVVIVGHSFGCLNSLFVFNNLMSQDEKNSMIERFLAIAPPFNGIFAYIKHFLGANDDYKYGSRGYGMADFREIYTSSAGFMSIITREYKYQQKNNGNWKEFAKAIIARIGEEEQQKYYISIKQKREWEKEKDPFQWFPHPSSGARCSEGKYMCGLNFYNYYYKPLAQIEKKKYDAIGRKNSILDLLFDSGVKYRLDGGRQAFENQNEHETRMKNLWNYVKEDRIQEMKNPKIPLTLIYGGNFKTPAALKSPEKFVDKINELMVDQFYPQPENFIHNEGDGTVTTDSALTAVLKWGFEFDYIKPKKNKSANYYPVHVVEYCSKRKLILPFYSNYNFLYGTSIQYKRADYKGFPRNTYTGLPCKDSSPRGHSEIISDEYVIKFVASVIASGQADSSRHQNIFTQNQQIQQLQTECPILQKSLEGLQSKDIYEKILNQQNITFSGRLNNAEVPDVPDYEQINENKQKDFIRPENLPTKMNQIRILTQSDLRKLKEQSVNQL